MRSGSPNNSKLCSIEHFPVVVWQSLAELFVTAPPCLAFCCLCMFRLITQSLLISYL